jgi:hypothetical protein
MPAKRPPDKPAMPKLGDATMPRPGTYATGTYVRCRYLWRHKAGFATFPW